MMNEKNWMLLSFVKWLDEQGYLIYPPPKGTHARFVIDYFLHKIYDNSEFTTNSEDKDDA